MNSLYYSALPTKPSRGQHRRAQPAGSHGWFPSRSAHACQTRHHSRTRPTGVARRGHGTAERSCVRPRSEHVTVAVTGLRNSSHPDRTPRRVPPPLPAITTPRSPGVRPATPSTHTAHSETVALGFTTATVLPLIHTPVDRCFWVREGGVEPPRPFGHWNLNPARLPIPPPAQWVLPGCFPVEGGDRVPTCRRLTRRHRCSHLDSAAVRQAGSQGVRVCGTLCCEVPFRPTIQGGAARGRPGQRRPGNQPIHLRVDTISKHDRSTHRCAARAADDTPCARRLNAGYAGEGGAPWDY